jgi:putative hydrolase of the HAD superfamily
MKNIIFDLGGVILNLDFQKTIRAFSELSGKPFEAIYTQARQEPIIDAFETGAIPAAEFREGIGRLLGKPLSDTDFDAAWNAMLLDFPPERVQLIESLASQTRVFLLSNTNEIHKVCCDAIFAATFPEKPGLEHLFEKAYFSHTLRHRKPHAAAFQHILDAHSLDPANTLFIDDTLQHVEGAQHVGLKAIHLSGTGTILDLPWETL